LELLTLALGDGLEQRERVSIWIWNTCGLFPQISGDAGKNIRFNQFLGGWTTPKASIPASAR
jgi:hypothetical protein